jgi:hypothetical protein
MLEVIGHFYAPVALSRGESLQYLFDCSMYGQSSEVKISCYYQELNSGSPTLSIVIILTEVFWLLNGLQNYPKED